MNDLRRIDGELVVIQRNPRSGAGQGRAALRTLVRELRQRNYRVRMFSRRDALDAFVTRQTADRSIRCLVAAGGDGTVRDLAGRHSGWPIAVLPMGTENLIARHLKISCDGHCLADTIDRGLVTSFDMMDVAGQRCLIMASAGFDADIVHRLHASRSGHIRHWNYVWPILRSIFGYRFPRIRVVDAATGQFCTGFFAIVGNFREYGLNLYLVPEANPVDGQLDICVFTSQSRLRAVAQFLCSFVRAPGGSTVSRFRSSAVRFESADPMSASTGVPLQTDGDPAGVLPVEIRLKPKSMCLLVSANSDECPA